MSSTKELVAGIIKHLKNGEDSRAGFAAKIDNLYRAIDSLEEWNIHVEKENAELRDQLALGMPSLSFKAYCEADLVMDRDIFDWRMESVRWRCQLPRGALKWKHDAVSRMKRRAYRDLLKEVKKSFLSTWEFNVFR